MIVVPYLSKYLKHLIIFFASAYVCVSKQSIDDSWFKTILIKASIYHRNYDIWAASTIEIFTYSFAKCFFDLRCKFFNIHI